jgi:hypothetical protein
MRWLPCALSNDTNASYQKRYRSSNQAPCRRREKRRDRATLYPRVMRISRCFARSATIVKAIGWRDVRHTRDQRECPVGAKLLLIKMVGLKPVAVITELLRALANKPKQEDVAKKGESDGPPFAR